MADLSSGESFLARAFPPFYSSYLRTIWSMRGNPNTFLLSGFSNGRLKAHNDGYLLPHEWVFVGMQLVQNPRYVQLA
jgi:hypothetical protein